MSYYQFNKQEILQKAMKNYSKEAIKKKQKNRYKNMTDEKNRQKKNIKKIITRN